MKYLGEEFKLNTGTEFCNMYRYKALLIHEGILYEGNEHVDILIDKFNMNYDDIDISKLESSGKIQTFDLSEDDNGNLYVIAHYQEFLNSTLATIKEYAKIRNARVAMYYVTKDFKCKEYIMI